MSLTKQTISGFIWVGLEKIIKAAMQLAVMAVLARLLDATEFGLMGLALVVTSFSEIFNDLGFGPAITQKEKLNKTDIHTGFSYSLIFGLILVILVWGFAPLIALFFKNEDLIPILKAVAFVLLIKAAYTTPLGLMYREMQFKKLSLISTFSYFVGYGATGMLLAYMGFGVWSLVFAVIAQAALSLIFYLYYNKRSLGFSLNKQSFIELVHFGGGYSLGKIFSYFANKGDKILVGRILGVEALGLYERGYQLTKYSASTLGELIDKVLFSPIARKQNNRKFVGDLYLETTYLFGIIFFPFSVFLFTHAKPLVRFILGDNWDDSIGVVKAMSGIVFFLVTTRIGSTIAKSLGDVYRRAYRTFIFGVLVLASVYFGSKWGVEGAALAVVLCKIIDYTLAFTQVKLLTGVKVKDFLEVHLLGLGLLGLYLVLYYIGYKNIMSGITSNILQLLAGGILLIIVYSVAFVIDYKKIIKKYYYKLTKKK